MTVAPRYAAYEDAVDTGLDAPLELPCCLRFGQAGAAAAPASPDRAASDGSLRACREAVPMSPAAASPGHTLGEQLAARLPDLPAGSQLGGDDAAAGGGDAGAPPGAHGTAAGGAAGDLLRRSARLYLRRQAGVERVFVGHPLYEAAHDIYGPAGADTYLQGGEFPDLDLRYSVLCQAALAAPLLLWGRPAAAPRGPGEPGGPALASRAPGAGAAADAGAAVGGYSCGEARQGAGAGAAGGCSEPRWAEGAATGAAAGAGAAAPSLGRILFVGNDWPCAPLALRLQHCVRAGQAGDCCGACCCCCSGEAGAGPDVVDPQPDLAAFRAALGAALRDAHSAFCIHNLAYQGGLPLAAFERLCLPRSARAALEWPQPGHAGDRCDHGVGATSSLAAPDEPLDARSRGRGGSGAAGAARGTPLASASAPAFACADPEGPAAAEDVRGGKRLRAASAAEVAGAGAGAAGPAPGAAELGAAAGARACGGAPAAGGTCSQAAAGVGHEDAAVSLNWMHAALAASDAVLTVSPTYAREICEDLAMSCGMQAILNARGVHGIMNGLDVREWDPATDALLPERARFAAAADAARGKAAAKRAAQRRFGLTARVPGRSGV